MSWKTNTKHFLHQYIYFKIILIGLVEAQEPVTQLNPLIDPLLSCSPPGEKHGLKTFQFFFLYPWREILQKRNSQCFKSIIKHTWPFGDSSSSRWNPRMFQSCSQTSGLTDCSKVLSLLITLTVRIKRGCVSFSSPGFLKSSPGDIQASSSWTVVSAEALEGAEAAFFLAGQWQTDLHCWDEKLSHRIFITVIVTWLSSQQSDMTSTAAEALRFQPYHVDSLMKRTKLEFWCRKIRIYQLY